MLDFSVTFIITIINLVVLFFVLRALLFKPVGKFIANRADKIRSDVELAEKDKTQAKLLLQQYEDKLHGAEAEAEGIIKAARTKAQEQAERIIAQGREAAELLAANTRKQLEAERRAALALFKAEAAALVIAASGRLLKRELNQEDSLRYAGLLLEEVGKN